MRALILLLALLTASPAIAGGPEMLLAVMSKDKTLFTINGYTGLYSTTDESTGIENIDTGAGNITVSASCTATSPAIVSVWLTVDGEMRDSVTCTSGPSSTTLTYYVSAGTHEISVSGTNNDPDNGSFYAGSFKRPLP